MKDFSSLNIYSEYPDFAVAQPQREEYLDGLNKLIAKLREDSEAKREAYMNPESYHANPEKYRKDYYEMLGWPLTEYSGNLPIPNVRKVYVASDDRGDIYRMQIEVLDGLWFYGMYFVPKGKSEEKTGLVIMQHGGGGSPELCSDIVGDNNYYNMTTRILDRGVRVFCSQILCWRRVVIPEPPVIVLPEFNRHKIDIALKQMGSSIQAVETYAIMRCLDYLCSLPEVDETKIGMTGLSYGGFYTMMVTAAEPRIVSAYSSCAMNDRFKYDWEDWSWKNSGNTFTDERVCALCAPRRFYGEVGTQDAVFTYDTAPDFNGLVKPFYAKFGCEDNFCFNIHNDGHKYDLDDNAGFNFFIEPLL